MSERLDVADAERLLAIAREALEAAAHHAPYTLRLAGESEHLRQAGAAFVTLRRPDGTLRGCIGSLTPTRALAEDVAQNSKNAALRDPRFAPVTPEEAGALSVSIAVLSPFEPIIAADEEILLDMLRPGIDGLVIRDRGQRAVFLPQVWQELPQPRAFLAALKRKAGLQGPLSAGFEAERFTVEAIGKE